MLTVQNSIKCQPGASYPGVLVVRRTPYANPSPVRAYKIIRSAIFMPFAISSSQVGAPAVGCAGLSEHACDVVVGGEG